MTVNVLKNLSFSARFSALVAALLFLACSVLTLLFIWREAARDDGLAHAQLSSALGILAIESADRAAPPGSLRPVPGPMMTGARADALRAATGADLAILQRDPATGLLRSQMTAAGKESGAPMIGTVIAPDDPAHAALMAGQTYETVITDGGHSTLVGYRPVVSPT